MLPIKTLLTTLLLAGSAFAIPEPVDSHAVENVVRDASANPEAEREIANLDKRDCKCAKVKNAGMYHPSKPRSDLTTHRPVLWLLLP